VPICRPLALASLTSVILSLTPTPMSMAVAQAVRADREGPREGPEGFGRLARRLQPAVVNISTTQRVNVVAASPLAGTQFAGVQPITREATSLGSGFIVSADGYVVTNNHVISGDPRIVQNATLQSVTVTLADGTEYQARVVGRDELGDLAVLKIEARKPLPFVQFGDSTRTDVGDWVVAIGNPFALGGTVTAGIVSAIHRSIGNGAYGRLIQTDAAINSGNSGGPMFDMRGNVIGINTAIVSPSGGNVGIGFAIPSEQARPIVDTLMKGGQVRRGYIGVATQLLSDDMSIALGLPAHHGEVVSWVEPGGAAAQAGVEQGDVIMKIAGEDVSPDNTLNFIVAGRTIGAKVAIELLRRGQPATLTAVVGERPSEAQLAVAARARIPAPDPDRSTVTPDGAAARAMLGITLQALTPQLLQQLGLPSTTTGTVIATADVASDAVAKGLKPGDVIVSVNQQPTPGVSDVIAALEAARRAGRSTVMVLVQRRGQPGVFVGVRLASG
jgi:serine protease Do